MCRAVQHQGLAWLQDSSGSWPISTISIPTHSLFNFLGGRDWYSNFYSNLFSEYNFQVLMCVPRRSSACSPRVPGLHGGRTDILGTWEMPQSSPCQVGIWISVTCLVSPGSSVFEGCVVMPTLLENNSKVRKSCSLNVWEEAAGRRLWVVLRQGEAVVGEIPYRTNWRAGRKVARAKAVYFREVFLSWRL